MGNKSEYEILQTLYRTHVRPLPHCPEWDHFGTFREWAEKTWSYGMALRKKDPDGIWCPENAEFVDVVPIPSTERVRMAKQWDIARVRIARMQSCPSPIRQRSWKLSWIGLWRSSRH